jgi:response regulator RpfG family c-di-GMP phosphodiesterase
LLLLMCGTRFSQTVPISARWPREQALEYIRSQAGKHFDPDVVELFLKVIGAEPDTAD